MTAHVRGLGQYDDSEYSVIVFLGPDHRFAYLNKRAEEITGKPARELLGRPMCEAFPEQDARVMAPADEVFASGLPRTRENVAARWKDARGKWRQGTFNVVLQPLRDDSGRVVGILQLTTPSQPG
jgi:PAS domain S-box-containing protein